MELNGIRSQTDDEIGKGSEYGVEVSSKVAGIDVELGSERWVCISSFLVLVSFNVVSNFWRRKCNECVGDGTDYVPVGFESSIGVFNSDSVACSKTLNEAEVLCR
jgi:hypothetical protein